MVAYANGRVESDDPWLLYVSFVAPHFPLIAPPEFYNLYPLDAVPRPLQYANVERPRHPVIRALNRIWNYDDYFDEEKMLRARAGYYGLCSFLDHNIGLLLDALSDSGAASNTRIIYTSDHGECLGNRGIWSTSAMYEESVGVPMILSGPGIPEGKEVDEVVSLVDLYPTIVESAGQSLTDQERALPGCSLIDIANGHVPDRTVLSEYHAGGSITASFMIRNGKWKYIHYVDYTPQLFDLDTDPDELVDLGEDDAHAEVRAECVQILRSILNPEEVNAMAFADQAAKIEQHGGVEAILSREYTWGGHSTDTYIDENGVITILDESSPLRQFWRPSEDCVVNALAYVPGSRQIEQRFSRIGNSSAGPHAGGPCIRGSEARGRQTTNAGATARSRRRCRAHPQRCRCRVVSRPDQGKNRRVQRRGRHARQSAAREISTHGWLSAIGG